MSNQHPPPPGAGPHQPPYPPYPPTPPSGDGMAHGPLAVPPGLPRNDNMYTDGMPPPPPGASRTATSRSGRGPVPALLALISALLLVLVIIGGILVLRGSSPSLAGDGNGSGGGEITNATVGECLAGESAEQDPEQIQDADLRVVDCTDTAASFTVVGRIEGRSQEQADDEVCQPYDQAELTYWNGRSGESGTVFCLETN